MISVIATVGGGDLGTDVEAIQKIVNRLDNINNCIVTSNDTVGRLINLDVTRMATWGLKKYTYRE
jgi:hypothetical protein